MFPADLNKHADTMSVSFISQYGAAATEVAEGGFHSGRLLQGQLVGWCSTEGDR